MLDDDARDDAMRRTTRSRCVQDDRGEPVITITQAQKEKSETEKEGQRQQMFDGSLKIIAFSLPERSNNREDRLIDCLSCDWIIQPNWHIYNYAMCNKCITGGSVL